MARNEDFRADMSYTEAGKLRDHCEKGMPNSQMDLIVFAESVSGPKHGYSGANADMEEQDE